MVKKKLWIVLLSVMSISLSAQSFEKALEQVKLGFVSGNFAVISDLFSESVDLTVLKTDGIYSKAQAKGVLKSFFENEKPKSFQLKHQGSSKDGTVYAIGLYESVKKSYRVYALFKSKDGVYTVVQLQIEEEL